MNVSHKRPLKQQLQQHYDQVQLNDSQYAALESLMDKGNDDRPADRRPWGSLAVVGMFLVTVVTLLMVSDLSDNNIENMPQLIAEEVVSNHLHLKPLEVETASINTVREYFAKLNFMPVESSLQSLKNLQLTGARYCSLQGITAAQLRMKQGQNLQTLYQTEYLPEVFGELPRLEKGEPPVVAFSKGIQVKIWVEKGLLFALTDAPSVDRSE